ncbi:hypothetical protein A2771_04390 [Candidatus Woesebacteria bacterium RIFCSPHIGHO2_01_FULL_38_26b]|uniref:Transcriptional regulator n=1 Tax=Candidatus Woesebacteria bacterium RIFCSPHIGHO2_01_FULL_38_26b TaxID=1802491 RepID=A0A1F7Y192_9BACT|nr:MAG: hypothetical protein A2771_04390 [Candidatus Woesebacteria bacterium RIFCSPHIGHO2_01_FULL_38_26b]
MDNSDIKKEAKKRINIMKGHLDALAKMIREGRSCTCLLDQSMAIQNSLKSLDTLIIKKYLESNVVGQFTRQKEGTIKELLDVYKRRQKRATLSANRRFNI